MKAVYQWVLGGSVALVSAASALSPDGFYWGGKNWDSMAWDRGGYFEDYYPHAQKCAMKKHCYHPRHFRAHEYRDCDK